MAIVDIKQLGSGSGLGLGLGLGSVVERDAHKGVSHWAAMGTRTKSINDIVIEFEPRTVILLQIKNNHSTLYRTESTVSIYYPSICISL